MYVPLKQVKQLKFKGVIFFINTSLKLPARKPFTTCQKLYRTKLELHIRLTRLQMDSAVLVPLLTSRGIHSGDIIR